MTSKPKHFRRGVGGVKGEGRGGGEGEGGRAEGRGEGEGGRGKCRGHPFTIFGLF